MRHVLIGLFFFLALNVRAYQGKMTFEKQGLVESIFQLQFSDALEKAKVIDEGARLPHFTFLVQITKSAGQAPLDDLKRHEIIHNSPLNQDPLLRGLFYGAYHLYNSPNNTGAFELLHNAISEAKRRGDEPMQKLGYFYLLRLYEMEIVQTSQDYKNNIDLFKELVKEDIYGMFWYHVHHLANITKAFGKEDDTEWVNAFEKFKAFVRQNEIEGRLMTYYFYNKGIIERHRKDWQAARSSFLKVVKFSQNIGLLKYWKFSAFIQLSYVESLNGTYDTAKYYLDQARNYTNLSDTVKSKFILNRWSAIFYYAEVQKYDSAYWLLFESTNNERELDFRRNTLRISELKVQLDTAEKEKRIAEQYTWLITISVFTVLLVLLLTVLWWSLKKIRYKNEKIETLMRELHHRVKNNLQVISSLLGLQSMKLKDSAAKKAVAEGKERIRAMSLIHQRLYQHEEVTSLDVKDYIEHLVNELVKSYGYTGNLRLTINVPQLSLNADTSLPIGLIINELVTNSLKYAFEEVDEPIIDVSLEEIRENQFQLMLRDNGPGLPSHINVAESSTFGLRLVNLLVKQLGGKLKVDNAHGVTFQVSFNSIG